MVHPSTIAGQVQAVAHEVAALVELLCDENATYPVADAVAMVESAGRLMDCARVRVLAPIVGDSAIAERLGYASPIAAVASLARISERSAGARLKVAAAVCADRGLTGGSLPAPHALVGDALNAGAVGLDAATLIATELASIAGRTSFRVLEAAESVMVNLACGLSPAGDAVAATVSVNYLAGEIRQVTAAADPDGARPREERATRRRQFRLGAPDEDGLIPANGRLIPEIGSLLAGLLEDHRRSPRFSDPESILASTDELASGYDSRTPGQRRHDALGEIFIAAAAGAGAPRLDGQPVSVLVTVTAADLANQSGRDSDAIGIMADSPFPVSRRTIERFIDAGGYRVVTTDETGSVTAISSPQRCFTPMQRLGMVARDGLGCSTPGCTSPHYMLQAHHVIPDRDDGPTALDNGILLCYWHHRIVDAGPWQYRMFAGIPYVRGPGIPDWTPTRSQVTRAA
ncbi:DUF222 domain-containing protein [Salinibacterium sp. G-O1]|uniref:HNH endonuclease signature motif containing protein n=1 Tax=Salinibacterium sp. G-O1 TaxID=3046208 RepID=UPI0024BAE712|nr:HNH endonuclease signature motif containing protein [Salinibacterium sp. G-O1]MDJ0334294.1 DUF222 domain-containing protein [Salinibacterium sp. G-O1]